MKVLHTSDWHLGKNLYNQKRYEEYEQFLRWLSTTIKEESIDILLIAGDIFDTGTPTHRAQQLYFHFLSQLIADARCQHIVITAGNHDSPSLLNATGTLLKSLNIHVMAHAQPNPQDEVLVLNSAEGAPLLIVGAVPYLREKDVRTSEPGESYEEKMDHWLQGVTQRYETVTAQAHLHQQNQPNYTPVVLMGHLFTAGGRTIEGDGVRSLHVGNISHISGSIFSNKVDYVALGHLHVPQIVAGDDSICYSGSPLPIGFGEADQTKIVKIISWDKSEGSNPTKTVTNITVPIFQKLKQIQGSWPDIQTQLNTLKQDNTSVWVEIQDDSDTEGAHHKNEAYALTEGSLVKILRYGVKRTEHIIRALQESESLADLNPSQVFDRLLERKALCDDMKSDLQKLYTEIIRGIEEADTLAE